MKNFSRKRKFNLRKIWQIRYRVYALIVIIIIAPIIYSSDKNIPENIAVEGLGYKVTGNNVFASKIEKEKVVTTANTVPKDKEEDPEASVIEIKDGKVTVYDKNGKIITEQLRRAGIDMGFISSQPFVDFGVPVKITAEAVAELEEKVEVGEVKPEVEHKPLAEIKPVPETVTAAPIKNLLVYDKYKIRVPVIYTAFEDLFEPSTEGGYDFTKPKDTSGFDSPVQKKLEQGIVHLAYTPMPGEVGNSYIVGHSSNYSFVKSPYNRVFEPIKERSQPGEEFIIYDRYGRELRFKVFEVLKIEDSDVATAYKTFGEKRVVTLQTSILGWRDGQLAATHRWLTRGELIE